MTDDAIRALALATFAACALAASWYFSGWWIERQAARLEAARRRAR
jgi:hypothetical protein